MKLAAAVWQFVLVVALTLWLGGLTFYGWIVVPTANQVVGKIEQGFITQRVSNALNLIALAGLVLLLVNACRRRGMPLMVSWVVMAASLAGLCVLHPFLDQMLDVSTHAVLDPQKFHRWHEFYLIIITVQWGAALVHLWCLLNPPPRASESNATNPANT